MTPDQYVASKQRRLHLAFRESLAAAITNGESTAGSAGLGPRTMSAIDAIAREHPEAAMGRIVEAHDAFLHEHVRRHQAPRAETEDRQGIAVDRLRSPRSTSSTLSSDTRHS
jgi:hypothetical protein